MGKSKGNIIKVWYNDDKNQNLKVMPDMVIITMIIDFDDPPNFMSSVQTVILDSRFFLDYYINSILSTFLQDFSFPSRFLFFAQIFNRILEK